MSAGLSPITIGAAIWVGTVALLILALQPILLGALVQSGVLNEEQLGLAATVEVLALAVASIMSPRFLRNGNLRLKVGVASLALAVVDFAAGLAQTANVLVLFRTVAGLLEGAILGVTIIMIVHGRHPERLNAIFLALSSIPQALGAYLLPTLVLPAVGVRGVFVLLGMTGLLSAAAAGFISMPGALIQKSSRSLVRWTIPVFTAIGSIFLQNAAIGAAWTYIERIASERGFSAQQVAIAASGNISLQVIGALLMAWIGWRLPFRASLVLGTLMEGLFIFILASDTTPRSYLFSCLGFGLLWLAICPLQLRLLIAVDPTKTAATWTIGLTLLGLAVGPFVGAFGVRTGDVSGAFWIAAGLLTACSLLYAIAGWNSQSNVVSAA